MDKLKLAEQALVKEDVPNFRSGDRVNIHYRVREGEKERIQQFEGDVISRNGSGANKTFIVRKVSAGNIGVERIFPLNSPFIAEIELVKEGSVRRSKLYYLRNRSGKSARIKEKDTRVPGADEGQLDENASREESVKDEAKSDAKRTSPAEDLDAAEASKEENTAPSLEEEISEHDNPKIEPSIEEQEQQEDEETTAENSTAKEDAKEPKKKKRAVSEEE